MYEHHLDKFYIFFLHILLRYLIALSLAHQLLCNCLSFTIWESSLISLAMSVLNQACFRSWVLDDFLLLFPLWFIILYIMVHYLCNMSKAFLMVHLIHFKRASYNFDAVSVMQINGQLLVTPASFSYLADCLLMTHLPSLIVDLSC